MKTLYKRYNFWIGFFLIIIWLTGCEKREVRITNVSFSSDPIVGRIVTLRVEVLSSEDRADATIHVELPKEINLVAGTSTWHGALLADQPQVHEVSICVLRPGTWRVWANVSAKTSPTTGEGDSEIIYIQAIGDSAHLLSGEEYHSPSDFPATPPPTPVPVRVSSECLANQQ